MRIWAFRGRHALLRVRRPTWDVLVAELGRRGGEGQREAGAFFLAHLDGDRRTVTKVVYFDDLDPHCLMGTIHLDGRAFSGLWDLCEVERLVVIGDVHTHGGTNVHQSHTDADNPMVARDGHVAVILPHLATRSVAPCNVGVHQYKGADGWSTWTGHDAASRLFVRRLL
jgi:hypothetical protein